MPVQPFDQDCPTHAVVVSKIVKRCKGRTAATTATSLGRWSSCSLSLLCSLSRRTGLRRLVLLGGFASWASFTLSTIRRCPQRQVVSKQLHDKRAVAIRLLRERIELGNGIVEGLLCKVAGTVGRVKDLVVENTEVERKTKADGVSRCEFSLCDIGGVLKVEN
jgi:hypothetical protein